MARQALLILKPQKPTMYKELLDSDLATEEYSAGDLKALKKLGCIGSGFHRNAPLTSASSNKKTMSWIWTMNGGPEATETQVHDGSSASLYLDILHS